MLKVSVYRYNPDQDAAPFMQEFQVDTVVRPDGAVRAGLIKEQTRVSPIVARAGKACAVPTA